MDLREFGWDEQWQATFANSVGGERNLSPGRVIRQHRERCAVALASGEVTAEVSGRFRHVTSHRSEFPTTGDWVACEPAGGGLAVIHAVLPRRSAFTRKEAGDETEAQVVAANVDTVFLLTGLDGNFNVRRIERYLTTAWESGASPVIVLNKADLRNDLEAVLYEVEAIALGTPVIALSAIDGGNVEALAPYLVPGRTAALLGSSGVGKSTLINRLIGEERLRTGAVSNDPDSRGRHTTTHRELVVLPGGGILIDTPGIRELQLWANDESLGRTFEDIEGLAASCRFADCGHGSEPGCAIRAAIGDGRLEAGRYESYCKQRRELQYLERKQDVRARRQAEKEWGKRIAAHMKEIKRRKPNLR